MTYTLSLTDDPYLAVLTPPVRALPLRDRASFALHYAVLAPSVHNTQPWRFAVTDGGDQVTIELFMDTARELAALDPEHRQLIISCGAALAALRAGLESMGLAATVALSPDAAVPRLLARITATEARTGPSELASLASELRGRRSYRGPMTGLPVSAAQQAALCLQAAQEGAVLTWVDDPEERRALEHLVALAALTEVEGGDIAQELLLWSSRDPRARDGVPPRNWQRTSEAAVMAPVVQRDFALGRPPVGALPVPEQPEASPALAVLSTSADTVPSWLAAGQALLRVLLSAHRSGLAVGYLNQPTEVPDVRRALAEATAQVTGLRVCPQLILRIGTAGAPLPPATRRRVVSATLAPPDARPQPARSKEGSACAPLI